MPGEVCERVEVLAANVAKAKQHLTKLFAIYEYYSECCLRRKQSAMEAAILLRDC